MTQHTTTSGATDLPEALRSVEPVALIASIQELNAWEARADGELLTQAEGESIILVLHELKRLLALAAGQATAAQPVAEPAKNDTAYAELPEPDIAVGNDGRALIYTSKDIVGEPYYTAGQLRAFADATHTLRASHGQAPATAKGDIDE